MIGFEFVILGSQLSILVFLQNCERCCITASLIVLVHMNVWIFHFYIII